MNLTSILQRQLICETSSNNEGIQKPYNQTLNRQRTATRIQRRQELHHVTQLARHSNVQIYETPGQMLRDKDPIADRWNWRCRSPTRSAVTRKI